jgi:hypothetical protein
MAQHEIITNNNTAMISNSGIPHQTTASGANMLIITTFGAIFSCPVLLKRSPNGDALLPLKKDAEAPRRAITRENFIFAVELL